MNEQAIKTLLQAKLAASPHGKEAAFISEMFIDDFSRRADLVMANGKLAAFEIKSEFDSLDRLDGQIKSYVRLFEQVTVVCAPKHISGVQDKVPEEVGIWTLTQTNSFKIIRHAKYVRQKIQSIWLSFLPVDEIRILLSIHNMPKYGTKDLLLERAKLISTKDVREFTLNFLKYKRESRIEQRVNKRKQVNSVGKIDAFFSSDLYEPSINIKAIPRQIN